MSGAVEDDDSGDLSAMKLGIGYNVWDCEELLWRSVACMREHAHFIVVSETQHERY